MGAAFGIVSVDHKALRVGPARRAAGGRHLENGPVADVVWIGSAVVETPCDEVYYPPAPADTFALVELGRRGAPVAGHGADAFAGNDPQVGNRRDRPHFVHPCGGEISLPNVGR